MQKMVVSEKQMPESVRLESSLVVQLQANREASELLVLKRLLELRLKQQDKALRQCHPAEFQVEQGKARAYEKLLNDIFNPPNQR